MMKNVFIVWITTVFAVSFLWAAVMFAQKPQPQPCKQEDLDSAYSLIRQDGLELQEQKFQVERLKRELIKTQQERDELKAAKVEKK